MKQTLQILKLIRGGNSFEIKKEDRKSFTVIGILIVLLVMIPGCAAAGFITYVMTLAFIEAGGGHEGLLFVIQFLSAFPSFRKLNKRTRLQAATQRLNCNKQGYKG